MTIILNCDIVINTYDKAGNIETVTENGKLVARYKYDGLNRLIREDNVKFGTVTYRYDAAGNILSKTQYAYTLKDELGEVVNEYEYSYGQHGWRDQLLSYNGEECKYDFLGNPLSYKGRNLVWQGRRLISYGIENKKATYTYDFNNVRTSKTATDGTTTVTSKYIYDGNNLIAEQRTVKGPDKDKSVWLYYIYGVDGIAGFKFEDKVYLYRKNVQGDITHIYEQCKDGSLNLVTRYTYDAYGNTDISFDTDKIGSLNPFRYRGYYFDIETKLYYLISRYYDPETYRFISADGIEYLDPETLGGLNLYAYCVNNPVMNIDPTGEFFLSFLAALVVAAVVGAATSAVGTLVGDIVNYAITGEWKFSSWETYVGNMIGGAVGGVISLFNPFAGMVIGGTLGTFAGLAIGKATGSNDMSWGEVMGLTVMSLGVNLMTAGLTQSLKIPGITKGSHSWQQVFKSGFTKALRYGFSMSAKTIAKEAGYLLISSVSLGFLFSNIINAVIGNGYTKLKDFYYKNLKHTFPNVTSPNTYFA